MDSEERMVYGTSIDDDAALLPQEGYVPPTLDTITWMSLLVCVCRVSVSVIVRAGWLRCPRSCVADGVLRSVFIGVFIGWHPNICWIQSYVLRGWGIA
jgi:hypothetical protein